MTRALIYGWVAVITLAFIVWFGYWVYATVQLIDALGDLIG